MTTIENLPLIAEKDYKYSFPYGYWAEPQIQVLNGTYEGLVFDVMKSGVGKFANADDYQFTFSYRILRMWKDALPTQFDGAKITLQDHDVTFISKLILSFIEDFNKKKNHGTTRI